MRSTLQTVASVPVPQARSKHEDMRRGLPRKVRKLKSSAASPHATRLPNAATHSGGTAHAATAVASSAIAATAVHGSSNWEARRFAGRFERHRRDRDTELSVIPWSWHERWRGIDADRDNRARPRASASAPGREGAGRLSSAAPSAFLHLRQSAPWRAVAAPGGRQILISAVTCHSMRRLISSGSVNSACGPYHENI